MINLTLGQLHRYGTALERKVWSAVRSARLKVAMLTNSIHLRERGNNNWPRGADAGIAVFHDNKTGRLQTLFLLVAVFVPKLTSFGTSVVVPISATLTDRKLEVATQ